MAEVTMKNLNKVYDGGVKAVIDMDVKIEDKEFSILVGPSGCGKTTVLRMIAGLETITSGEIYIGNKLINNVLPKNRDIAMVFQNYALYPHMTVYDNMAFALKIRKTKKSVIDQEVKEAAKLLEIEHLLERKPKALSGGQRQRVALGRAIVRKPQVFLFDEPLSNLDAKLRVQMRAEIIKLHKKLETTMIYVTHDQVEAMTMADKIVVMKDGLVQQVNDPLSVYNTPENLFVAGFIGSPAINQFNGKLIKEDNEIYFMCDNFKLALFEDHKKILKDYEDKEIIFGIRPEDVYDSKFDSMAESPQSLEAVCEIVEPMGNEYIVFLKTDNNKITARFDPKKMPEMGKKMKITFDMAKGHYFDPETEKYLI
ncbi:MAG: sn-glycerol-3-phosphate ABC transporter ATP-binding protein UgpC [Candidatus Cloacimonetes bacterium]|nr:sn-glycerol-3-phosphate ABC transporter ATP-binding protein UgpC [Candidatus Cloacimonadota bacterium]